MSRYPLDHDGVEVFSVTCKGPNVTLAVYPNEENYDKELGVVSFPISPAKADALAEALHLYAQEARTYR